MDKTSYIRSQVVTDSLVRLGQAPEQISPSPHLEKFFNITLEQDGFAETAWGAAVEIAKKNGMAAWRDIGNSLVDSRVDVAPWMVWRTSSDIPQEFSLGAKTSLDHGHVTMFRGGKLPDPQIGSFGFGESGVHLSPWISVAQGYASNVNQDTGAGRVLKFDPVNPYRDLGFLSTWDVPLTAAVWSNFHHEDYLAGKREKSTVTARNFISALMEIANRSSEYFENPPAPNGGILMSAAEKEIATLHDLYYEVVTNMDIKARDIFIQHSDFGTKKLIKIDPADPQWDEWMARIYEANLRDFYEILPLERVLQDLKASHNSPIQGGQEYQSLLAVTEEALSDAKQALWHYKSMREIHDALADMPWITTSCRVGSATSNTTLYPPHVQEVIDTYANLQARQRLQQGSSVRPLRCQPS